ncbi:MAG: hypothetical protein ACSHYB_06010 [Roseibacillus sp.]
MNRTYLPLLVAICSCLSMPAQDVKTQKVGFFAFKAPVFPAEVYLQIGKGKFEKVRLVGANASKPLAVINSNDSITLYAEPILDAEGEERYPIIGRVKVQASWPSAFVVLSGKMEDDQVRYTGTSFPISKDNFPSGSIKFANLSKKPIRGKLGRAVYSIAPGKIETLRFQDPEGTLVPVVFQFQNKDKSWARMTSNRWRVPKDGHRIMFAYQEPDSKVVRTKTIPIRDN